MPTRLRLYVDKNRLVDEILKNNRQAYKDLIKMTSLCRFLRIPLEGAGGANKSVVYALTVCARSALDVDDFGTCSTYCNELLSMMSSSKDDDDAVWRIFRTLATNERFRDKSTKRDFLQVCLSRCRDDELVSTLTDYVRMKNELVLERFISEGVASTITEETEKVKNLSLKPTFLEKSTELGAKGRSQFMNYRLFDGFLNTDSENLYSIFLQAFLI